MNIYYYRRLKNVNRLGNEPILRSYNLLEHSYMVTALFCHFAKIEGIKYTAKALEAIMHHDVLEVVTGDLPYNIKNLTPETKACWQAIERVTVEAFPELFEFTDESIMRRLTSKQRKLFRVCDLLDLWIFLQEERRLGNTALPIHEIIETCKRKIQTKYKSVDDFMMFGYTF